MKEQLWTIAQVAEYLNVDKFTIYRLIANGKLPAFKVGNQWRFKKSLIEKWLKENTNTGRSRHRP
jgi:excisionase family DNA binding protein